MSDLESAVDGSDCIVLLVDHDQFRRLDPGALASMRHQNLIDCRNSLDHKQFQSQGFTIRILGNPVPLIGDEECRTENS
jgi:UDP-N-acetyl-D-mannosaminuronic acid dehydrogenase